MLPGHCDASTTTSSTPPSSAAPIRVCASVQTPRPHFYTTTRHTHRLPRGVLPLTLDDPSSREPVVELPSHESPPFHPLSLHLIVIGSLLANARESATAITHYTTPQLQTERHLTLVHSRTDIALSITFPSWSFLAQSALRSEPPVIATGAPDPVPQHQLCCAGLPHPPDLSKWPTSAPRPTTTYPPTTNKTSAIGQAACR